MIILLAVITVGVMGLTAIMYINARRRVSSAVIQQLTVSQVIEYLKDRQS